MKPFVFFDLGQTLINEWDYIKYFDHLLLQTLNDYGARIDYRNYNTLRNNILLNRKIGSSGFIDLVLIMAQFILPKGYDIIIYEKLKNNLLENKKKLIKLYCDVTDIIPYLSKNYSLGIISNNSTGSADLLIKNNLNNYFKIICLSQNIGIRKPDHRIFLKAMEDSSVSKENCVMVGDRLDIDIYPANVLGIKTIRTLNSIYRVQKPINHNEKPLNEINSLSELPNILSTWF